MRAKTGTRQHTLTYAAHAPPGTSAEHRACFTPKRSLVRTQYRPPKSEPGAGRTDELRDPTKVRQWWWSCRPRDSTGVAPGRVHCGTGRLVGPQVATPSASE